MNYSQNVWVDTTLKDHEWFSRKFLEYRRIFPLYRIAIFQIVASDMLVAQRLADRGAKTGRVVPPEMVELAKKELANALQVR
jgi:hypothetical protein